MKLEYPVTFKDKVIDTLTFRRRTAREESADDGPAVVFCHGFRGERTGPNRVFVTVARGIGNCELLADDVRQGPLARTLSFPYHPHVTVAHDVPTDMQELAYSGLQDLSAEFRVEHFTEFEQTAGGAWAVAREYRLTGPERR